MQSILFEYPEFFLSILLLVLIVLSIGKEQEMHCPNWLAQPAKRCLLFAPETYLKWINKSLTEANWRSNFAFGDFASAKIYLPLLSVMTILFLAPYSVLGLVVLLFFLPDMILTVRVKQRQREIQQSLPQALDLMVLCIDAGLGLDATLQRISNENSGIARALYDELSILGRDILLGMDRERAYQELYNRTGVDELKTLGSALAQASKLGLSIARILRAQSEFIRKKQSQKIEEKAMKMPIYMAFPLWFCIMPALMLLVLGPSLIKFYHQAQLGQ